MKNLSNEKISNDFQNYFFKISFFISAQMENRHYWVGKLPTFNKISQYMIIHESDIDFLYKFH